MMVAVLFTILVSSSGEMITDPRYPSLSPDGSELVFCWRGMLWETSASGGDPRCLTPGRGEISHPVYSPDGEMIAFTSSVTGGGDVYVMSSSGGSSTRLTYHGGEDRVLDWDGDMILFSSSREGGDNWVWEVSTQGGTPHLVIPAPVKNLCVNQDGIVFESGYTPWWRQHYRGSASSSLWQWDGENCLPLGHMDIDQRWPMVDEQQRVFMVMEDQNGHHRFCSIDGNPLSSAVPGGITFPAVSSDGSRVVYESEGKLFTASTDSFQPQEVFLPASVDLPFPMEELFFAGVYTTDFSVASDGTFMVMEAEGEIYAVPVEDEGLGDAVRITTTSALESQPRISPDGTMILFQREWNGQVKICMGAVDLSEGEPLRIDTWEVNTGCDVSTDPRWAPSGDFSFLDGEGRLYAMDVLGGRSRALTEQTGILHHSWSPDSRWIAFSTPVEAHREDVFVIRSNGGNAVNVSRHPNDDFQPEWPSDGRRLIWASRTDEGDYSIIQAWFRPEDWEADTEERDELLDQPVESIGEIDSDLYQRTEELCQVEGYYDFFGITPDGRRIYFPATDQSGQMDLWSVDWDGENLGRESFGDHSPTRIQPTDTDAAGDVYYLSYGSSLRTTGGELLSWSAPCSRNIGQLQKQKFFSAWRLLRDNFYDESMHGVDWDDMLDKYGDRAGSALLNSEFNDVVRRMLGELSASHLGIYGPWEYSRTAYTGETGIFADNNWMGEGIRVDSVLPMSPAYLAGFKPGDLILSIDQEAVGWNHNFYAPLRNTADREVQIEFSRNGDVSTVRLTPVSEWDLWQLIYDEWIDSNRRRVSSMSGDRVGYLHIPSMNLRSVRNFRRDLYAEGMGRDAMIIDVRGNGGGSTHDQILENLARETYAMSRDRYGSISMEPLGVYRHPLVLLIDETCYSDAEIFPAAWKELGIGPVIGNTTYGAVIGTRDIQLTDGTGFRLPGTGWYTLSGTNLENTGVAPDIFVEHLPCHAGEGVDLQLDTAVETALDLIR